MTKRIMFVGPSGIGKTTLAQYVAKSQNIPLYQVVCRIYYRL